MRVRIFAIFLVIFLMPIALFADIAPMPGQIRDYFAMKSESVKIDIGQNEVRVEANFVVTENKGAKKPEPLQYCRVDPVAKKQKCGEKYYQFDFVFPELGEQKFKDFKAYVDGKEMNARMADYVKIAPLTDIPKWYVWSSPRYPADKVKFPSTIKVKVTYREPLKFNGKKARVTYVLRSGALWAGKIGSAEIEVKSVYPATKYSIKPSKKVENVATWEFASFEPEKDLVITILKR